MKLLPQHYFIISNIKSGNTGSSKHLKSKYLKENIGPSYIQYVRDLEEEGYISRGKSYQTFHYSKKFTLTEKGKAVRFSKEINQAMEPFVHKLQHGFFNNLNDQNAVENLKETINLIKSNRLTISLEDYRQAVKLIKEDNPDHLLKKLDKAKNCYDAIKHHKTWAAIDTDGGNRIYTILQSMPKELRQFIKLDNEYCTEFDLTNAQPYFFAYYLLGKLVSSDVKRFHSICKTGKWNQYVAQETGLTLKEAKKQFINYLFSNSHDHGEKSSKYKIDLFMIKNFPTIHDYVLSNNFYKEISRVCRELESKWSHRMIKEIRKETIAFTVHDCIIVPSSAALLEIFERLKDSTDCVVKQKNYKKENEKKKKERIERIKKYKLDKQTTINVARDFTRFHYQKAEDINISKVKDFYKDFSPDKIPITSSNPYDIFKKQK